MSLRFLTDGTVVVDTVAEALDFDRGRNVNVKPKYNARPKPSKQTLDVLLEGTWEGFCQLIEGRNAVRMRKILALIKGRYPDAIELDELQGFIGDDNVMMTSGTLSGIVKNATKAGLNAADVIVRGPGKAVRAGALLQARDPPEP